MSDPYGILGMRADASAKELRRAYLRLARRYHPDQQIDVSPAERALSEDRMRALNEAWERVGTPERREAFDAAQARGFQPFAWVSDDDADPREAPDVPYRPGPPTTARSRALTLGPVLLFAAAVAVGIVGVAVGAAALLALAALLVGLSGAAFVAVSLRTLTRARRDEG